MAISYSKLFVGISLPALCTGLASLLLSISANAQTIRPTTQKELKVFDPTTGNSGNIGIRAAAGTLSYTLTLPAAAPSVNQVLSASAVTGGNVSLTWATPFSGTGTTNYLAKFANAGSLTNSLLFDNGTNVGVGTATPSSTTRFEIRGTGTTSATTALEVDNSNGIPLLVVKNDGSVGIGTTSPGVGLEVVGVLGSVTLRNRFAANNNNYIDINYNTINAVGGNNLKLYDTGLGIDVKNGNVGIGTTNPTAMSDGSNSAINNDFSFAPPGSMRPNPSGTHLAVRSSNNEAVLNLLGDQSTDNGKISGVYFSRIGGQEDAHINVASIQARLTSAETLGGGQLWFFTKPANTWAPANSPRMVLDALGRLGIGVTSPQHQLDVSGDINITGSYRINGVPQSGTSKWTSGTGDNIYKSSGNVGIGTTSPVRKFSVQQNSGSNEAAMFQTSDYVHNSSGSSLVIRSSNVTGNSTYEIVSFVSGGSSLGNLALNPTAGSVGIGTTDPGSDKLQINEPTNADISVSLIARGGNSKRAQLNFAVKNSSATNVGGSIGSSGARDGGLVLQGNTDSITANNAHFFISAGGETRLRASSSTLDQGDYNLQVNGTGVWAAGAYFNGSDSTLKKNIKLFPSSTEALKKLRPVTYNYKSSYNKDTTIQAGFIAQEVQEALKSTDYVDGVVKKGSFLSIAYQSLIPLLTKALQESIDRIELLEKKISILEQKAVKN